VSLVVLDTDVASALLRRRASAPLLRTLDGSIPAVTFVTIGELTKWTLVRHWGPIRRDHVRTFLDAMVTLPYESLVATRLGEIQAYAQLRGRPRPANDSWIAACWPGARRSVGHLQHQGLHRLRRTRRPSNAHLTPCEASASSGQHAVA
jgi:predicted nucleic acid-binding protein